jgi:methyl-accepting chemotaxis protein
MSNSQTKSFPAIIGLVSIVLTSTVLVMISPWLHETFMPSIGLGLPWDFAALLVMSFLFSSVLTWILNRLRRRTSFDDEWLMVSKHMPRKQVADEVREVAPYLDVMSQQLDGAIKETEHGVMSLIASLNSIHAVSDKQMQRINTSDESGAALSSALEEKMLVDKQLGMILRMFVDKQQADVAVNLGRIKRLQEVQGLTPLVADISQVAKQTNILAINAAVEAARAGDAGRGFAVLAAEIRLLSNRTAAAAVNISAKIKSATEGIDDELRNATAVDERSSATGNMRKVIADIDDMQHRFSAACTGLLGIIESVKTGHSAIVTQLSEAMGQIQFQDVIRQRVEHVQKALEELNDHLQNMADQLVDKPWDPQTMVTLRQRLDQQVASYVMKSQVETHQSVTGKQPARTDDRPKIELF